MNAFSNEDRSAGWQGMQNALTPIMRAQRQFVTGRPSMAEVKTPLAAVSFATEQHDRLLRILSEKGIRDAKVTSAGIVVRFPAPVPGGAVADTLSFKPASAHETLKMLEIYGKRYRREFVVAGALFVVRAGQEKALFRRFADGSEASRTAVLWAIDRQSRRVPQKGTN
jgi:hypothetical protein